MIKGMYTLFDNKALIFLTPFLETHEVNALRTLERLVSGESEIARHAEDFDLMKIGDYNDETGFCDNKGPAKVMNGLHCKLALERRQKRLDDLSVKEAADAVENEKATD